MRVSGIISDFSGDIIVLRIPILAKNATDRDGTGRDSEWDTKETGAEYVLLVDRRGKIVETVGRLRNDIASWEDGCASFERQCTKLCLEPRVHSLIRQLSRVMHITLNFLRPSLCTNITFYAIRRETINYFIYV